MAKKITKKECVSILRSCLSLLNQMSSSPRCYLYYLDSIWFMNKYKLVAVYLSLSNDLICIHYPLIVRLYNVINEAFISNDELSKNFNVL